MGRRFFAGLTAVPRFSSLIILKTKRRVNQRNRLAAVFGEKLSEKTEKKKRIGLICAGTGAVIRF